MFPQAAVRLGISPDPGAVGAIEGATDLLGARVEAAISEENTRQLCFGEMLQARRFADPPSLDEARRMRGDRRPAGR